MSGCTSPPLLWHRLPTETHSHILSFCDAQTLASVSLVSLASLELAGPHLYRNVTVTGYAQLDRLFYDEEHVSSAPHLDRFLSLAQTHTFTFVGTPGDASHTESSEGPLPFPPHRSSNSFPIRVHTLSAEFINLGPPMTVMEPGRAGLVSHRSPPIVAGSVLNLFDPEHVALRSDNDLRGIPAEVDLDKVPWTRPCTLTTTEIDWTGYLTEHEWFRNLPPRSLTVKWNILDSENNFHAGIAIQTQLVGNGDEAPPLLSVTHPVVKEVILRVTSTESKEEFEDSVNYAFEEEGNIFSLEEIARQKAMFRWVVEPDEDGGRDEVDSPAEDDTSPPDSPSQALEVV